ncbi:abortive infection system antitoxin AbiGi family protein [Spirosoma endbachense]|uniref:DUF2971 domain-containing protein n=1 Tax=Spirosoma endbachense TaxID=2666025 RepID=A0A6P1W5K5_9BACT|nr:abortive infection system antitoxin AbiGi family protein [Spirosoma endbachense]QHV99309.1 hypothetical protein GJR95_31755 [Spirosoma endbachense]
MGQLSANALFHFTPKLEWLASILEHGFKPRYCEEFNAELDDVPNFMENASIPMTCFCDIPLSSIAKHAQYYGKDINGGYGIGLKKNERLMGKLSPILYFNKSTQIINMLEGIQDRLLNVWAGIGDLSVDQHKLDGKDFYTRIEDISEKHLKIMDLSSTSSQAIELVFNLRAYMKPYQNKVGHYRYYDEKEWRYIPDFNVPPFTGKAFAHRDHPFMLKMKDEFFKDTLKIKDELNESINQHPSLWLTITAEDIKYLIVKNEQEIHQLLDLVREIDQRTGKFPIESRDLIASKIVTCEQIFEDY